MKKQKKRSQGGHVMTDEEIYLRKKLNTILDKVEFAISKNRLIVDIKMIFHMEDICKMLEEIDKQITANMPFLKYEIQLYPVAFTKNGHAEILEQANSEAPQQNDLERMIHSIDSFGCIGIDPEQSEAKLIIKNIDEHRALMKCLRQKKSPAQLADEYRESKEKHAAKKQERRDRKVKIEF